jgi:signal transduction histidine kinase
LAVLCRLPTFVLSWRALRIDPGAVLLLARHASLSAPFPDGILTEAAAIEDALGLLTEDFQSADSQFVDFNREAIRSIYLTAIHTAHFATELSLRCGKGDPERAWACGLLAPLGWLAISAVDPGSVASCLADVNFRRDPRTVQQRHWGLDQDALARRLARRWKLPDWLANVIGRLGLPVHHAESLGANAIDWALTRQAIRLAAKAGHDLGLLDRDCSAEDASVLGGPAPQDLPGFPDHFLTSQWRDPRNQPLLLDLLASAADNRRLRNSTLHRGLEAEIDSLHQALENQARTENDRLQSSKLAALAEFAGGAGHEINNPLAVISGQAQYLLAHEATGLEADPDGVSRKALNTIIDQTWRVHHLLRDLMQFARPAAPRPAWFDLPTLLGETAASLCEFAEQRRVRLEIAGTPDRLPLFLDGEQVRTTLNCLLRNALEAAPADGWARLGLRQADPGQIEVIVEDSGPGPLAEQRPSLFDPFFSGRSAGRGRGLGLPLAWRLARLQGGDVRLENSAPNEPTRFILRLPRIVPSAGEEVRSAA